MDDKGRGKKGLKFKFYKKKVPEAVDVEEGVEAFEEVPAEVKALPIPKKKYRVVAHKYPWTAVATVAALLLAYFCQKPTFLSGILVGVILSFITALWSDHLYRWMTVVDPETNFLHGHYNFENVPFLSDKVIKKDSTPPEHKCYKGWMNELPGDYNPQNYHISQTETVFVKLVGSILRLCTPKGKIPKRAFWSEPKHTMKFTRERAFDISRCEVQLLPENLTNKRKWSRKYPMVIYLLPTSHLGTRWAESRKNLLSDSDHSYEPSRSSPVNEKTDGLDRTPRDSPVPSVGEPASKKSPTGSPTHCKPSQPDQERESNSKSAKSSAENSPKKVAAAQEEDSSFADPPSVTVNDADDEGDDEEDDSISDFVKVSPITEKTQIVIFARSAREKDLWYRRLVAATTYTAKSDPGDDKYSEKHAKRREKRMEELRDYVAFMKSCGQFRCTYEDDTGVVTYDHTNKERENYLWLNLFLARILYDAMRQDFWIELIKSKIQKKLAVIRVPAFIEPITLAEIKFSGSVPAIEWTHNVSMNDDGIWTEVEISYQGTMTMTVNTKLNAFTALAPNSQLPNHRVVERPSKMAYMDSSQEDSGETSTEEMGERTAAGKTLAFIDKVGSSKFIQQLKETRFVKKAMEDVSNTPIHLNVRVNRLIGTLVLNIPPPPSDRLWYGFKPNVEIHMECKPIVGARNINVDYISNMIEKVMRSEFQKVIVMPNMDDLVIPLMNRDMPY
uniref:Testis-expressed sequence 2 protein n=1 Tax=Lygus hesperus TaxID=30085 RepID=A0A0A9YCY7_LYGHE